MIDPIELKLTEREIRQLLENSIERMINTTINVCHTINAKGATTKNEQERLLEYADTNGQDWIELKSLVCKIWNWASEEERKKIYNKTSLVYKGPNLT